MKVKRVHITFLLIYLFFYASESQTHDNVVSPHSKERNNTEHQNILKDITKKVESWSNEKKACVGFSKNLLEDKDHQQFCKTRKERAFDICRRYHSDGLLGACRKVKEVYDGESCTYGNCGEATYLFACFAASLGIPYSSIQFCGAYETKFEETDIGGPIKQVKKQLHMFPLIPDSNAAGKLCLLDRWTITNGKKEAEKGGKVRCGVTLSKDGLKIDDVLQTHPWYQGVECSSFNDYMKNDCAAVK
jgi:hypothetical protein